MNETFSEALHGRQSKKEPNIQKEVEKLAQSVGFRARQPLQLPPRQLPQVHVPSSVADVRNPYLTNYKSSRGERSRTALEQLHHALPTAPVNVGALLEKEAYTLAQELAVASRGSPPAMAEGSWAHALESTLEEELFLQTQKGHVQAAERGGGGEQQQERVNMSSWTRTLPIAATFDEDMYLKFRGQRSNSAADRTLTFSDLKPHYARKSGTEMVQILSIRHNRDTSTSSPSPSQNRKADRVDDNLPSMKLFITEPSELRSSAPQSDQENPPGQNGGGGAYLKNCFGPSRDGQDKDVKIRLGTHGDTEREGTGTTDKMSLNTLVGEDDEAVGGESRARHGEEEERRETLVQEERSSDVLGSNIESSGGGEEEGAKGEAVRVVENGRESEKSEPKFIAIVNQPDLSFFQDTSEKGNLDPSS
ncbi:hypothetical protein GUITHDRAFT_99483 [Guillardia theta CCMP2712]|uniref:Uncharacterized protein n=1 Tax=Guillardia theta (strain CCMP2712) TaxID=905079 RepID=L1K3A4_GUITC|nr:hypothetical protein GUITHDRAFT_99483 [Guillardia theta CCMP2712]EKX54833.1 hypothetical protein GUITHDRAFT_99483 [Guillardia theta CCMP2712]|eukprot:XP_005841813.1 hypothetical protein GUITHDRAFT_99483 [Guillardia theta CCMP2712]